MTFIIQTFCSIRILKLIFKIMNFRSKNKVKRILFLDYMIKMCSTENMITFQLNLILLILNAILIITSSYRLWINSWLRTHISILYNRIKAITFVLSILMNIVNLCRQFLIVLYLKRFILCLLMLYFTTFIHF